MGIAEFPQLDLSGRVALITGAAGGLGLAIAQALGHCGARIVINDLHADRAQAALSRLTPGSLAVAGDVSIEAQADRIIACTLEQRQTLDILINNAGLAEPLRATDRQELAVWRKVVDVNLQGSYLMARAAARHMRTRHSGSIVNIASVAGLVAFPASNAYGVSKAAVAMMTKTLACDLARFNIRVNAIAPGVIEAPMAGGLQEELGVQPEVFARRTPLGRMGQAVEVARAVAFLASDWASYITGAVVAVDGGWSAFGGIGDAARAAPAAAREIQDST